MYKGYNNWFQAEAGTLICQRDDLQTDAWYKKWNENISMECKQMIEISAVQ